jgi:transposase InsO family protein
MSETFPGVARRRRLTTEDFKRDCVRINPLSNARTALSRVDHLMEGNNSEHPHFRVGYRSPCEYMRHFNKRVSALMGSTPCIAS